MSRMVSGSSSVALRGTHGAELAFICRIGVTSWNRESPSEAIMPEMKWPHLPHPRNVSAIVEDQVKRWALRQEGRQGARACPWPVVTISRESGTGGGPLGRRLATRLGFSCWDREIVTELARLLHTDETTINGFDERSRGGIEDFVGMSLFSQEFASADYSDQIRRIVDTLAHRGRAVIVGRGAQFLIDPHDALRVRLVAPLELRAREVETRENVSFEVAKQMVESDDRERAAFVLQVMGRHVADPTHYDIVVNTASYGPERADALVLTAYLAKFGNLPLTTLTEEPPPPSIALAPEVPTRQGSPTVLDSSATTAAARVLTGRNLGPRNRFRTSPTG